MTSRLLPDKLVVVFKNYPTSGPVMKVGLRYDLWWLRLRVLRVGNGKPRECED